MYENLTENDKQILLNTYNMWCYLAEHGCMTRSDYPGYGREIMNLMCSCGYCHVMTSCDSCSIRKGSDNCNYYWYKWRNAKTTEDKAFYASEFRDIQAEFLREIGVLPAEK